MPFDTPYGFKKNNLVVIRHQRGKHIRVRPGDNDEVDDNGGKGGLAQWNVEIDGQEGGQQVIKLRSAKTGRYLRIKKNGSMDVGGGGGGKTRFKVHRTGQGSAKLESCKFGGKYIAVKPKGPAVGGGGKWCELQFFRNGGGGGGGGGGGRQQVQQQQYQQPVQQQQPVQMQQQPMQQQYQQPMQQQYQQQPVQMQQQQYQQQPMQQQYQQQPMQMQQQPPMQQQYQQQPVQMQQQQQYQQPVQMQQVQQVQPVQQMAPAEQKQQYAGGNSNNNNAGGPTHPQPFPDARPSIPQGPNNFEEAADKLRSAMKGLGTNEKKLIEVTASYSYAQRLQIREVFDRKHKRSLIKDLRSETSGKFERLLLSLWYLPGELDARLVHESMDGIGFNTELLNEVLCTRTNKQIAEMKRAWSRTPDMEGRVREETSKMFSNNTYQGLMLGILRGNRPPNGPPNEQAARADAETLNRVLTSGKQSEAKAKFVEIFLGRSWVQIRTISNVFQDISKKYTLVAAVKEAFGSGSDTCKALCTIAEFSTQPYDFFAMKLRDAMKGMGTNDDLLIRVIASRADIDLGSISAVFGQRHGDGKTLINWIKNDTSGDYEKLLMAAAGNK